MTTGRLAAINRKTAILKALRENPAMTYREIGKQLGVSPSRVGHCAIEGGIRRLPADAPLNEVTKN